MLEIQNLVLNLVIIYCIIPVDGINLNHTIIVHKFKSRISDTQNLNGGIMIKFKKNDTKKLTLTAMLSVICIIMALTPLGYIPTPALNITLIHIPVIIAGIVGGASMGMRVGLVFGITSLIRNLVAPGPVSFVFYNPLISVLPRVLIGLFSSIIFELSKKIIKNLNISFILSAITGTITNTVGVLGMIYVFYANSYIDALTKAGGNPESLSIEKLLLAIIGTNMLPEIIAASVITLAVCKGIYTAFKI